MPKSKVPRTFFNIIHTDSEGTTFHCKLHHCTGEITVRKSRKGNTNQLWVHLFREHGLTRQFVLDSVAQRIPFDQQMIVLNTLGNRIGHPFQVASIIKASKGVKSDAVITPNKNKDNSDFDQSVDFDDESIPQPLLQQQQQSQRRQSGDSGNGNGIVNGGANANHRVSAAASAAALSSTSGTLTVNLSTPAAAAAAAAAVAGAEEGAEAKSGNLSFATLGEDEGNESESETNDIDESILSDKNGKNTNVALINGSGVAELRNHITNGHSLGFTPHHHNIKRNNHSASNVINSNDREIYQQHVIEELIARQHDTNDDNAQFDKGRFEKLMYLFLIDNRLPIDVVTRQSFRSLIHEASKSNESIEFVNGIGHDGGSTNNSNSSKNNNNNNNNNNDNNSTANNSTIITTNSNGKQ